jgi:hypothetical protein
MYGASLKRDAYMEEYPITTPSGLSGEFYLRGNYTDFEEKQQAVYLQIPLMLDVQTPLSPSAWLYVSAGAKFGFSLKASATQKAASLTTVGYSQYADILFENLPQHGFATYNNVSSKDDFKPKTAVIAAMEVGLKWKLSEGTAFYTGAYVDYGLNNVHNPA